jgi:ETC complex I subunit conserved region
LGRRGLIIPRLPSPRAQPDLDHQQEFSGGLRRTRRSITVFTIPLMGWTSSGDTRQQVTLKFDTKEEAIAYAQREGYAYVVEEPKPKRLQTRAYSDNFKYDRVGRWTH